MFCVLKLFKICMWSASTHPNHLVALVTLPKLWRINEHALGFQIFNTPQLEENQLYHLIFLGVCHFAKVLKHFEVKAIAINNFEFKIKWKSSHCKVMWGNPKVFWFWQMKMSLCVQVLKFWLGPNCWCTFLQLLCTTRLVDWVQQINTFKKNWSPA